MDGPKGFLSTLYGIGKILETVFPGELIGVHSFPCVVGIWLSADQGAGLGFDIPAPGA